MYVILPKNSDTEKLKAAQRNLTAEKIEKMISLMVVKTALILFPKMHLTSGYSLKKSLQELGLRSLFEPQLSDLSVMSEGSDILTEDLFQSTKEHPLLNDVKLPSTSDFDMTDQLIFDRMSESDVDSNRRIKRDVRYKTESESNKKSNPLTLKDFMLRKKIVKKIQGKKLHRNKRQLAPFSIEKLDVIRHRSDLRNLQLYAEDVIHKVDLTVNEKGTEGGAATAITLNRSGTSVVLRVEAPFLFLIRHDFTRVPLFYGAVFEPEN